MTKMQDNTKIVLNDNNNFGKTGKFVRENQKSLLFIVAAVVLLAAGYLIYLQMYRAQDFWEKKDWDKAINGDAGYPGFAAIINNYGSIKSANLAYFYLGVA